MKLTNEQLKQFEELGETQFSIEDCAIILGCDPIKLTDEVKNKTPIGRHYEKGRLSAEGAVRKSILQQAKQGSSPAQKQILEIIKFNRESNKNNKSFDLSLCVFVDTNESKQYYQKTDVTKLFAIIEIFFDGDGNEKYKIQQVKKISGQGIELHPEITTVFDDAIRIVAGQKLDKNR